MFFYLSLFFAIIVDIFTKFLAKNYLFGEIKLIGDFFSLKLVKNSGIAFSLPLEGFLLKIITLAITILIFIFYFKNEKIKKNNFVDIAFGFILGGAIGNGIERIFVGNVIDFFSLKYFAIFNFADIFINIGVILLLFIYLIPIKWKK